MRQDEVTTLTMQPQPLYLFTPTPLPYCPAALHRARTQRRYGCCTAERERELTCVLDYKVVVLLVGLGWRKPWPPLPPAPLPLPSSPHPNEAPPTLGPPTAACLWLAGLASSAPSDDLGGGFLDDDPWAAAAFLLLTGGLTNETPTYLRFLAPAHPSFSCSPAQIASALGARAAVPTHLRAGTCLGVPAAI